MPPLLLFVLLLLVLPFGSLQMTKHEADSSLQHQSQPTRQREKDSCKTGFAGQEKYFDKTDQEFAAADPQK